MVEIRTTQRTGASLSLRDTSDQSSQCGDNEDGGQLGEHHDNWWYWIEFFLV